MSLCACVYMYVCMREYVYVLYVGMCLRVPMSMCMYVYEYEYVCMCIHLALLYPGFLFEFKGHSRSSPRPFQAIPEKNLLLVALGRPLHRKL